MAVDLRRVVGDAGRPPHVRDRVGVARVVERVLPLRAEVRDVRDLAEVERLDQLALAQAGHVDRRRERDVVAAVAGRDLGQHRVDGVEEVVGDLDPVRVRELLDRVLADVVRPVVDEQLALGRRDGRGLRGRRGRRGRGARAGRASAGPPSVRRWRSGSPSRRCTPRARRRRRPWPCPGASCAGSGTGSGGGIGAARSRDLLLGLPGPRPGEHHRIGGSPADADGIADRVSLVSARDHDLDRGFGAGAHDVADRRPEVGALLDLPAEAGAFVGGGRCPPGRGRWPPVGPPRRRRRRARTRSPGRGTGCPRRAGPRRRRRRSTPPCPAAGWRCR